ncbi:MAG: 2-C-methyl-D-erythritol 4-phosphate cytidylyltransferase [Xanthobacteraceae bacterium]|jgi:2-C-methyl-D-erythritol 4-phosphate cytidylyltransferase/2-C-methyl-D-erythritol 2,4-cyclodiphosphate synthase|nr:2-C-methyl-D-erythritol 4-phosphate cytidylyltransferase [Xanthobacteraceae bacterium]
MAYTVAAVVVAAGRGVRAGGEIPKQYQSIGGVPVIRSTLAMLAAHHGIGMVQAVIQDGDLARFAAACAGLDLPPPVLGGATRQQSVMAGLEALISHTPDIVLVHDAARPFATAALVDRAIAAARAHGAAVPVVMLSDTVKQVDADGCVVATPDRATLRAVQTPQAFSFGVLLDAHRRAAQAGRHDFTDDAALCEWAGIGVHVFDGEATNMKLTTPDDFAKAEAAHLMALGDVRTGGGFDVHAFGDGDHVMLGGVPIAHTRGLSGHSDADVVLHALVDAILGALSDGDIGQHFPPSDPQWRGAASDRFLAFAVERVRARGGMIAHLDTTVICEAPKIGPHRDAMRARIAQIAGIAIDRVAVKATTSEQLGFTGRREGIAAMASATVRLPWSTP